MAMTGLADFREGLGALSRGNRFAVAVHRRGCRGLLRVGLLRFSAKERATAGGTPPLRYSDPPKRTDGALPLGFCGFELFQKSNYHEREKNRRDQCEVCMGHDLFADPSFNVRKVSRKR